MNNEYIQRIAAVLNALNTIEVKGKPNLASLSGSIAVLEDVLAMMQSEAEQNQPQEVK